MTNFRRNVARSDKRKELGEDRQVRMIGFTSGRFDSLARIFTEDIVVINKRAERCVGFDTVEGLEDKFFCNGQLLIRRLALDRKDMRVARGVQLLTNALVSERHRGNRCTGLEARMSGAKVIIVGHLLSREADVRITRKERGWIARHGMAIRL